MCTVSFFKTEKSLIFTSSRDEKRDRGKAVFPCFLQAENKMLSFPKDKRASGTWFVTDEKGNVVILLNGAFQKHERQPAYKESRGIIILNLVKNGNILSNFYDYDLSEIEPFQLLVYWDKELFRILWDGQAKHEIPLHVDKNYLLSSRTLYNDEIVKIREDRFHKFQKHTAVNAEMILKFHKDHQIEKELNMDKAVKKEFMTVSITQLIIEEKSIEFIYYDLAENIKKKKN